MKKSLLALTLVASLGLAACNDSGDEVVLTSKLGDYTQAEFYNDIKELAGSQLIEQMMVEKVLADKYDVSEDDVKKEFDSLKEQYGDSFELTLAQNGLTEDALKSNIRLNLLKEQAKNDVEVTEDEIKAYYEQAKVELNARHILVADKETADKLVKELKDGGDFAKLAKENSTDTASGAEGGDLGWFSVGKMVPEFTNAAYALKVDEISEPVQSQYGYHIIQVTEKRDVKDYGSLEDKKEEITTAIKSTKGDANAKIVELMKAAKIEVKDADFKNVFSSYTEDADKKESADK